MLEIVYGLILTLVHYFNDDCEHFLHKYKDNLMSLAGGVSISYILLILFPELTTFTSHNSLLFFVSLVGFTLFHIVEKHVYQHKSKKKILHELKEIHSFAFFIYHLLLGITIVFIAQKGIFYGLLFFIPIFLHSVLSNISFSEIHHHLKNRYIIKISLSIAPILGILLAIFHPISNFIHGIILAFIVGALLYIVIRDLIPYERKGHVVYFIIGTTIMSGIILLSLII